MVENETVTCCYNRGRNDDKEISFKEYILQIGVWIKYLITKWMFIVLAGILCGGIGFIYAYLQKPTYRATLSFALEDEKSGGGGGLSGLASQFGFDVGVTNAGGAFNGANLIELMKSRSLVEKTLLTPITINGKETSLAEYYINIKKMRNGWQKNPQLKGILFLPNADRDKYTLQQDSVLGTIYENLILGGLSVSQKDKKVGIISIDVRSENELFAKLLAENLSKVVSDFYVETKSKKARLNVSVLEKQSDSIRTELNAAISSVASANDNTYNLNPALNIKRVPSSRRQVDVQANMAILSQLVQNLELAKVTLRKETPLIQVIDKPILPLPIEKIGKRNSLIVGGFIGALVMLLFFVIRKWWGEIMT